MRDRFVAIFGAGPNVGGGSIGKAVIVLDINTGQALRTFTGMDNGVAASPTVILDGSGYIRFAYVVDINGNLWKFDFRSVGDAVSTPPYSEWTAAKLFTPAAGGQPAYHRAEVAHTTADGSNRYIFYGTGDQERPVTNLGSGKFYAIKDTDTTTTTVVESSSTLLNVTPTIANNAAGGTVSTSQSGWVVNLDNVTQSYDGYSHSGEKVLADPVVFFGKVYFTTYTTNTSSPCSGGGIARVYGLDYQTGAAGVIADATIAGETSGGRTKVPYHVYGTSGLASSPSLSINPSGQSSIFIGFSTSQTPIKIDIESPAQTKILKSWKELF
jgi:type IV pilus assembly protein PilY1